MVAIRLSPSGAPIGNAEGGQANPVTPGLMVRLAELTSPLDVGFLSTSGQTVLQDPTPAPLIVAIPNPDPNKRYKVNTSFELDNQSTAISTITVEVEASYDNQSSWNVLSSHAHLINGFSGPPSSNQTRLVTGNVPMTLGSGLATPLPANAPEIAVRITAGNSAGQVATTTGGTNGTFWVSLVELL